KIDRALCGNRGFARSGSRRPHLSGRRRSSPGRSRLSHSRPTGMQRIVKQDRSKTAGRYHLPPPRSVIGLEAEFSLIINDKRELPEKVFGTAQKLIRHKMLPRTGRSFQLPSGGAIYFDTGVIEVATPIVELEPGCCYRATRLLWEQIHFVGQELRRWAPR